MKVKRILPGLAALAVAITPVAASAASQTSNTPINATVADLISMTTSGTVAISLTPTSGGVVSSGSVTVQVSTNRTAGYILTMKDSDTTTSLSDGASHTIAAHTGTFAAPTALANNSWGYAIAGGAFDVSYSAESNNTTSSSKWAGVPASSGTAATLKTTSSTATNDPTTVWYAVKADSSQVGGTYTDTVTYTATTR